MKYHVEIPFDEIDIHVEVEPDGSVSDPKSDQELRDCFFDWPFRFQGKFHKLEKWLHEQYDRLGLTITKEN
jgi:hypothetical protein